MVWIQGTRNVFQKVSYTCWNGLLFELYGVPMPRRLREIGNDGKWYTADCDCNL